MELDIDRIVGRQEWEFVIASLVYLSTTAAVLAYTFILEPLTTIIFVPSLGYKVQGYLMALVQGVVDQVFQRAFITTIVAPDGINPAESAIVLSNHHGFLDYLAINSLSEQSGIDQSCFFFVWKHCVRLPSWRTLWNQWRKYTNWKVPFQSMESTLDPLLSTPYRAHGGKWLVLFPEVIPWSAADMLQHRTQCAIMGCEPLNHLLYPRFSGFVQTVSYLREQFPALYDVSIIYIHRRDEVKVRTPSWVDIFLSIKDWEIRIEVRRVTTSSLPRKEKHLIAWLEKRWFAKDKRIDEFIMQTEQPAKDSVAETRPCK